MKILPYLMCVLPLDLLCLLPVLRQLWESEKAVLLDLEGDLLSLGNCLLCQGR